MTTAQLHQAVEAFALGSPHRAQLALELIRLTAATELAITADGVNFDKLSNLRRCAADARQALKLILGVDPLA